jgi:hypothetical protein
LPQFIARLPRIGIDTLFFTRSRALCSNVRHDGNSGADPGPPTIAGPHGEGAKLTKQSNGTYLLSYTEMDGAQAGKHLQ